METELTPMQRFAYDTVAEILDIKRGTVVPCMAHVTEIRNSLNVELMEALRELCRKGILSVSTDVNKNPMFKITGYDIPTTHKPLLASRPHTPFLPVRDEVLHATARYS